MSRFSSAVHRLILALLLLAGLGAPLARPAGDRPAAAQALVPATWTKGFVMIGYGPDSLNVNNVPASLAKLKATGANAVALAPIWFMPNQSATTMRPVPLQGTPSDDTVAAAIRQAHGLGLRVMLRPYIDLDDGSWRADITPSNVDAWFASYTQFINHYLDLARAEAVEEFTVGVELINMTQPKYDSYWKALITQSRARYAGVLTYSANWGKHTRNEYKQITWWGLLDYIGLSAYFPISLKNDPTVDDLVRGWSNYTDQVNQTYNWVAEIQETADQFKKPVVFTEIGFGSYINSPARWDLPQRTDTLSLEAQDRAVEATLRVWTQQPWFHGLYWWHWDPYAPGGGPQDPSDTINNKPAEGTITRWFGGSGQAPPTAPPGPPTLPPGPPTQVVPPTAVPPTPTPAAVVPQPIPPGPPRPAPAPGTAGQGNPAFDKVASPGSDTAGRVYFPQTGHTLEAEFLAYWHSHGGLAAFGYPISEPYQEINATDGKAYVTQYFERQRFEYHPEKAPEYHVLLGLLGVSLVNGRNTGPFAPVAAPGDDTAARRYFPQTGHTLSDRFLAYWQQYGGLAMFGYPLSEPFAEVSATDNKTYTVQYFERARFESHPENADPFYQVLLGFLGRWFAGTP